MNTVYIVIPVYNERKVIGRVIDELRRWNFRNILVVDDGSTDGTQHIVRKKRITTVRHTINRGKGAAIITGIEAAKLFRASTVVTFDGDGQHDPRDITILLAAITRGYNVVLGSRFLSDQPIPHLKRIGNYFANVMTYIMFGIWVSDSQSGLRAYDKKAYSVLQRYNERYGFDTDVLRAIRSHNLTYTEVPISVRYTPYSQKKENRQNFISAILTMIKIILAA